MVGSACCFELWKIRNSYHLVAMDPDSDNVTVVKSAGNPPVHDVEKGKLESGTPSPVAAEKMDEGFEPESDELPFSNARLISLVLTLSLAAFLNVSFRFHPLLLCIARSISLAALLVLRFHLLCLHSSM
jgi:hypothetical protein